MSSQLERIARLLAAYDDVSMSAPETPQRLRDMYMLRAAAVLVTAGVKDEA